jgi:hypothetical protein
VSPRLLLLFFVIPPASFLQPSLGTQSRDRTGAVPEFTIATAGQRDQMDCQQLLMEIIAGRRILFLLLKIMAGIAAIGIPATFNASATGQIFLGPAGSGTTTGYTNWLTGANGAGFTGVDFNDQAEHGCDFVISNTVAGRENNGDWRCVPFSLGAAAGGARPITFSFAYKFENPVIQGDSIHVQLRFFDATGTNFISERVIPVGTYAADSSMTGYRTITLKGIHAPRKARTVDIWVDANLFEPWVSGLARFDSFSVTTEPRSLLFKTGVAVGVLMGIGGLTVALINFRRRSANAN